jgi:NMD protein affecting ribosome stability and mRNA decay
MTDEKEYHCEVCGREISREDYEQYDGMCMECYEIEIDELDYEEYS